MQPRLERYAEFLARDYAPSLAWNGDYAIDALAPRIADAARRGVYRRILFTGMGCSAIVSDVVKGFFAAQRIPVHIEVVNDYDLDYLCDTQALARGDTLAVISSYSGHSQEPIHAYRRLREHTRDIVFLTTGGELGRIARTEDVSMVQWRLRKPDREYPLFHVPQYFAILLDLFYQLGVLPDNYALELRNTAALLRRRTGEASRAARAIAGRLRDRDIILIASAKWHLSLLKLADMHLNEMAMARAHRNHLHEFTHSEIAVLTDPAAPHALVAFADAEDDEYTRAKLRGLGELLRAPVRQNRNIELVALPVEGAGFIAQLFSTLQLVQHVALELGRYYDTASRELISQAAGNPWYNARTIASERAASGAARGRKRAQSSRG